MSRYYFINVDSEYCGELSHVLDHMEAEGVNELEVFEANIEYKSEAFFCKEFGEIGIKGEGCGTICSSYAPRNGKSGICKHSRNPYTHGKRVTIIKRGRNEN